MSRELANLLTGWRERLSREGKLNEFVFPSRSGSGHIKCINHAWYTAVKKAGLRDFRFHELRHTFASWLRKKGAPLDRIKELLGHKTPRMTYRYAHLQADDLSEPVEELSRGISWHKSGTGEGNGKAPDPQNPHE